MLNKTTMKKRNSETPKKTMVEPALPDGWEDDGYALSVILKQGTARLDYRICHGWNPADGPCQGVEWRWKPKRGRNGESPCIPDAILAALLRKAGWVCTPPEGS